MLPVGAMDPRDQLAAMSMAPGGRGPDEGWPLIPADEGGASGPRVGAAGELDMRDDAPAVAKKRWGDAVGEEAPVRGQSGEVERIQVVMARRVSD